MICRIRFLLPIFILPLTCFSLLLFSSTGVQAQNCRYHCYQAPQPSEALPDYYLAFQISNSYGRPLHPFVQKKIMQGKYKGSYYLYPVKAHAATNEQARQLLHSHLMPLLIPFMWGQMPYEKQRQLNLLVHSGKISTQNQLDNAIRYLENSVPSQFVDAEIQLSDLMSQFSIYLNPGTTDTQPGYSTGTESREWFRFTDRYTD